MPLDKQAELFLKQINETGMPPLNEMPVAEARAAYRSLVAQHGIAAEPLANISNRVIPGPNGSIPLRIYTPHGSRPLPVLVYFHGGGWVLGNLDVVHGACTVLANHAYAIVVAVDYRLAPEHRFPAAVEDCWAATRWVARNSAIIGADPERIAVGGDSAGGCLAAVIALMAREQGDPELRFQLLFYPVTDTAQYSKSWSENGQDYFLTADLLKWFYAHYLPEQKDRLEWRASPLRARDKSGLAPALIITAEYDPLRDEGEAYAEELKRCGTKAAVIRYPGQIHAFAANLAGTLDDGRKALEQSAHELRQAFRAGWRPRLWL
jgi:acetyl esterase